MVDSLKSLPSKATLKRYKKAAVAVQSTQNIKKVEKIINRFEKYITRLEFYNTICQPTSSKQQEAKTLSLNNDIMIVIGSKTSANTKRLYEISKSLNKKSYWIQSQKDLKKSWFSGIKSVGITAGASTPDETTKEVVNKIKKSAN